MEALTVEQLLALPGSQVLARHLLAQVKNVCICTGIFSLGAYLSPRLQLESLQIESIVSLNLWRLTKFPRWVASAVLPSALFSLAVRSILPALKFSYGDPRSKSNIASRSLSWIFHRCSGRRPHAPSAALQGISWQTLAVLHLSWLPAVTYYRWFSLAPTLRSFFCLKSSAESSAVDSMKAVLTPQSVLALDLAISFTDRVVVALRSFVIPRLLGEPIVLTQRSFYRQSLSQMLSALVGFVAVCAVARFPDIPIRSRLFSGTLVTTLRPERHVVLIMSLIEATADQLIEKMLRTYFAPLRGPPPNRPLQDPMHLTPQEEEVFQRVMSIYPLRADSREVTERLSADGVQNPTLCASRRAAFATIHWAAYILAEREKSKPKQEFLVRYKDELRRVNREIDDAILVRQDTTVTLPRIDSTVLHASSSSAAFGVQDSFAGDVCAVCLSKLLSEQDVVEIIHCGHTFHADCISTWLAKSTQCPCCRYDVQHGKEAAEIEVEQPLQQQELERHILTNIDALGFNIPHTYDFEEWGVVRSYCYTHGISCNTALSTFSDDCVVNQVTYWDLLIAPLLFCLDAYNPTLTLHRTDYINYR